jgi:hypothetical protein
MRRDEKFSWNLIDLGNELIMLGIMVAGFSFQLPEMNKIIKTFSAFQRETITFYWTEKLKHIKYSDKKEIKMYLRISAMRYSSKYYAADDNGRK